MLRLLAAFLTFSLFSQILDAQTLQRPGNYDARNRPLVADIARATAIAPEARLRLRPKYRRNPGRRIVAEGREVPGLIVVKFADGARVRALNPQGLDETSTDQSVLNTRLNTLISVQDNLDVADIAFLRERGIEKPGIGEQMTRVRRILSEERVLGWNRMHRQPLDLLGGLRARAELRTGRRTSDLANYYWVQLDPQTDVGRVLRALNAIPIIEKAYRMPQSSKTDIAPPTADYSTYQGYLDNDGNGIHARFAWTQPGGKGNLVRIIDIEDSWNPTHEDLPAFNPQPVFNNWDDNQQDWAEDQIEHGTAVAGIMVAKDDGTGVTGIVPQAVFGVINNKRRTGFGQVVNNSGSILDAAAVLQEGDVVLIEAQVSGPRNVDCTCETSDGAPRGQCGMLPVEWSDHNYEAIVAASNSGLIVVEPAGNGEQNLDDPLFDDVFNRAWRDSGALIVAASESGRRERECFSNHGDRIDLHAWGEDVATTGYGNGSRDCVGSSTCLTGRQSRVNGRGDPDQFYTSGFSGTSSASPIVAGAAAAIQGIQFANNNPPLNWLEMRDLLSSTGTPPRAGNNIGPLPNLQNAIAVLDPPTPPDAEYDYTVSLGALTEADNVAGLSTSTSSQRRVIGGQGGLRAIERIMFAERGDRPCYIRVEKAHILDHEKGPRFDLDECGNRGHTDNSVAYVPLLTTSHDTFINKVAVCNSKTNNHPFRLKGIRVWRTRVEVEEDGTVDTFPLAGEVTKDRPNCDDNWRTPSTCPAGSVAAQVEVHLRADGNDLSMSGLRLICREIQINRTCVANC